MSKPIRFQDLILKETDSYIFINKPAFISTLEDRASPDNILAMAREYWADAQVGHRLDKETSGVLVIAKNPDAYRNFSIQLEKRKVEKEYHAIVDGIHEFDHLNVEGPLYTTGKGTVRVHRGKGKEAFTQLQSIEAFKFHTLVACFPKTGRMHQIRVHLADQHASIAGDALYGGKPLMLSQIKRKYQLKKGAEELPIVKRVALHAHRIRFEDIDGEPLEVTAPYPKDFEVALKQLRKNR